MAELAPYDRRDAATCAAQVQACAGAGCVYPLANAMALITANTRMASSTVYPVSETLILIGFELA